MSTSACAEQVALRAQATASQIAGRLAEPPDQPHDRGPGSSRWHGQSLAAGAAGITLLHAARARAGQATWEPVHAWLARAASIELSNGPGAGLWYGAPAVAFAVAIAAPPGTYRRTAGVLDAAVRDRTDRYLTAAGARLATGRRPARREYDLVHGLSGLGAYLLHREPASPLTRRVLAYLVTLTEPLPASGPRRPAVPGWWACDVPGGQPASRFRDGHADSGMAHGICGPLALLALAKLRGITVGGHEAAIGRICRWLDTWRQDGETGPWWPERITYPELATRQCQQPGPARPSWCYGTPGVARAQQLAGLAAGDHHRAHAAEHALAACLADPVQYGQLTGPAVCHGQAGVLLSAWHAARDARSEMLSDLLPSLLGTLLSRAGDTSRPGLIEGSAGIALALHTVTQPDISGWERCLLIT